MKNVSWSDAAAATNRVTLACRPHISKAGDNPLKVIYDNNLPSMMKDVVYYCALYGTPVDVAMDMITIYDACRILDDKGYLDLQV